MGHSFVATWGNSASAPTVHGARSALRTAKSKEDRLSQWAVRLAERSHPNVAAIALANKTARMAWAMLRHGTDYQPNQAAA
jgi:transposase